MNGSFSKTFFFTNCKINWMESKPEGTTGSLISFSTNLGSNNITFLSVSFLLNYTFFISFSCFLICIADMHKLITNNHRTKSTLAFLNSLHRPPKKTQSNTLEFNFYHILRRRTKGSHPHSSTDYHKNVL